jgi:murein DD-endopeptidase MepM/ murein hydrolase activator NlpD
MPDLGRSANARVGLLQRHFPDFEIAPDLGSRIGTLTWYRGAATCLGLCGLALLLSPGFENPIYGYVPPALQGSDWEAAKAQAITPLARGAVTGTHMAATGLVSPLTDTPERPIIKVTTNLASGTALTNALQRSGVGLGDADHVVDLIKNKLALGDIQPGTALDITLGRRADKSQPRPLINVAFRARFDLRLEVVRNNGTLGLNAIPIAIDNTPLRIQGEFGSSLYRSARAAGAPAKAVEAYIKSVATRVPVSHMGSACKFDLIVEQARAETGEVRLGNLMFAGVNGCASKVQLVRWSVDGHDEWYDGSGKGERTGMMSMPVAGHITSSYGMRRHPLLGYTRMHKGMDIGAPYGAPIYAATDGVVAMAGRNHGYGNFVKLNHAGGLATGYGHMSRIAVSSGQRVRKGQVIGYIGSTGMSTGPHLHYELYRNGVAINPNSVAFTVVRQLTGGDLSEFRARLGRLMSVPVGAGAHEDETE